MRIVNDCLSHRFNIKRVKIPDSFLNNLSFFIELIRVPAFNLFLLPLVKSLAMANDLHLYSSLQMNNTINLIRIDPIEKLTECHHILIFFA